MRGAIEARDALLGALARNPLAFSRPKPTPKPLDWRRSAKGNLFTKMPQWGWMTVFKTNAGTFKWACRDSFSKTAWLSEDEAVADALREWEL